MDIFVESFLNEDVALQALPLLLKGLWITLLLTVIVIPLGTVVGFLIALLYTAVPKHVRVLVLLWIDFFRAIPPLVLLVFVFYGLPLVGIVVPALLAAALAMTLNTSSYYGEIFRNGFKHVPKGQIEAARSTGLSQMQALLSISAPQAIRNVWPDLVGNSVEVVKATSIASVVAIPELLRMARIEQGNSFNSTPLIMAAGIYLAILWPAVRLLSMRERKTMGAR